MYENHFSIKLISIEKLYIMTTMTWEPQIRRTFPDYSKLDLIGLEPPCFTLEEVLRFKSAHPNNLSNLVLRTSEWIKQNMNEKDEQIKYLKSWNNDLRRKYDKVVKERDSWKFAYSNQEKIAEEADLEITKVTKLKSIISDYENKITKYQEKIDIQGATIISLKTEVDVLEQLIEEELYSPVIECELEPIKATQICNGLKCKGKNQPLESFIKNGKTLKNCKICRDHKCSLCKKSRNKSKKKELNELD